MKTISLSWLPARERLHIAGLSMLVNTAWVLTQVQQPIRNKDGTSTPDSGQLALQFFFCALRALTFSKLAKKIWFEAPIFAHGEGSVTVRQRGFLMRMEGQHCYIDRKEAFGHHIGTVSVGGDVDAKIMELLEKIAASSTPAYHLGLTKIVDASNRASFSDPYWDDPCWDFWKRWYRSLWADDPMPPKLLLEIASIEEDAQRGGPVAFAERIREIETSFYTSVGPSLVQRPDGKWEFEPDASITPESFDFTRATVEAALNAALSGGSQNGLTETSGETVLLRSALDDKSSASIFAVNVWNACMSLNEKTGDVYPDDPLLIALTNTLYVAVEEVCEQDNRVRERIARLASLRVRRNPTLAERQELAQVPAQIADDLVPSAREKVNEAIEIVVGQEKPARVWRARVVNWLTTIGRGIEQGQKSEKKAAWLLKLGSKIIDWFDFNSEDDAK